MFFNINSIYHKDFLDCYFIISDNLKHIVLCAAHRGRLNLLTGLLNFPPEKLFRKLRGVSEFSNTTRCTGDVISHLINSTELNIEQRSLHVTMLRNPSHLEIVNPVSMGKTRGIMQAIQEAAYGNKTEQWSDKVINIQVRNIKIHIRTFACARAHVCTGCFNACVKLCRRLPTTIIINWSAYRYHLFGSSVSKSELYV